LKSSLNGIEDKEFEGFCEDIGVSNIRQYEERELRYFFHSINDLTFFPIPTHVLINYVVVSGLSRTVSRNELNSKIRKSKSNPKLILKTHAPKVVRTENSVFTRLISYFRIVA